MIAIALVPGRIVEVEGRNVLEDDPNWRIQCLIANTGASSARIVESNLSISKLGLGTVLGLIPVFPRYSTVRDSFPNVVVLPGERQMHTVLLDTANTMLFRILRSREERGRGSGALKLICIGFIHYVDEIRVERRTGFAFNYDNEKISFSRIEHPTYSYAD